MKRKTILGQPYIHDILRALLDGPKRYGDLSNSCPNETTRTIKLRRLESMNLITTMTVKIGKRPFVHYKLTEKGERFTRELGKLINMLEG